MIVNNIVYGGPALQVPAHLSFGQLLFDKLRENSASGDSVALVNGETGHQTTYKQILQGVANLATGIRKIGIKRGDVVALCSENRDEYLFAVIASICCGATVTYANPLFTKDEMNHVLKISRPSVVFASEEALKKNLTVWKSFPSITSIIQMNGVPIESSVIPYNRVLVPNVNINEFEVAEVEGWKDVVYILYSSGTTGLPKGVMLTHVNVLYSVASAVHSMEYAVEPLRLITIAPWYHALGIMSTLNYICLKNLVVYLSGFNPQKYLGAISQYKVNTLVAVPPIVVFLAKHPIVAKYDLSCVKYIMCGAAPLSEDTIATTLKRFPNCKKVLQGYGMTETSMTAMKDSLKVTKKSTSGSVGAPLPGTKAKVVDIDTGVPLGANKQGEIRIKGIVLMKGYAENEEESRAVKDEQGYLKTGDIGYYDQDGYFYIVDRLKELIKHKGFQVPPAEVESVILQHPEVADCGVVGAPDEAAGELPTAFVVKKPGSSLTEAELVKFAAGKLSHAKRLHGGVIFVSEIPKNPSGKILRRKLKQMLIQKLQSKL